MTTRFFILFFIISSTLFAEEKEPPLRVNIFCSKEYVHSKDCEILKKALERKDCIVHMCHNKSESEVLAQSKRDVNIFCETLNPPYFYKAWCNFFIPNPCSCEEHEKDIKSVDYVVCLTKEMERIFKDLGHKTLYIGFRSLDCYDIDVSKSYRDCLHLAEDRYKGTLPLIDAWAKNPDFPFLNIVTTIENLVSHVPDNIMLRDKSLLQKIQNIAGIHLCLSETETVGHSIMEAMSTGAVVIATDAPPMNEYIEDKRCLVPYVCWRSENYATHYYVDAESIEHVMKNLIQLSDSELQSIGEKNRERFVKLRVNFEGKISKLLEDSRRIIKEKKKK